MNDLIERQAAINAVSRGCQEFRGIFAECEKNLNELPSAQPKLKLVDITDISEIFEPKFTEEEIQMMQELEAAEIEKRHISLAWKTHKPVAKDIYIPINDTISRQAAIDAFHEMASDIDYLCSVGDYVKYLESMPSAQPEIVRCKDCRFNTYSKKCLNPDSFFLVPADDFYCGYAERREDE